MNFLQRFARLGPPALLTAAAVLAAPSALRAEDQVERPLREAPYRAANSIYSEQIEFFNPLFDSGYRGADRKILGHFDGEDIREEDLFVFLTVAGHPAPNLYELYTKARTPRERFRAARALRDALRAYALTHRLARQARAVALSPIQVQQVDTMALAGHMLAWTEGFIEPQVRPTRADALREYRAHPFDYYRPARATVRVILKRFEAPEPPDNAELARMGVEERFDAVTEYQLALTDEREAAAKYLDTVREAIADGRLDFDGAALRFSDGESKANGGLLPNIQPGDLAPQLEAEVFGREAGYLSPVVRLPEGVAFVRVEEIRPEGYADFRESLDHARETARLKGVEFLFNRELRFISPFEVSADAQAFDDLALNDWVVKGPGYYLDKAAMLALHPEVEDHDAMQALNFKAQYLAKSIGAAVHVRKLVEEGGLGSSHWIRRAREIATAIVQSKIRLREMFEEGLTPAPDVVLQFKDENPILFTPAKRRQIILIGVPYPETSSKIRSREMAREMLEDFRRRAQALLVIDANKRAERRAELALAGEGLPEEEESISATEGEVRGEYDWDRSARRSVITNLVRDYRFTDINMVGIEPDFLFPNELDRYLDMVKDLKPGEFSGIEAFEDQAALIYLVAEEEIAPEEFDQLRSFAATEHGLDARARTTSLQLDAIDLPDGGIDFLF